MLFELHSDHLCSKWGFSDGELLDSFLESQGYCKSDSEEFYQLARRVLCEVVERHLCSVIEQDIRPYRVETSHNPIRIYEISGTNVADLESTPELSPHCVEVSEEQILELARALHKDGPTTYTKKSPEAEALARDKGWD